MNIYRFLIILLTAQLAGAAILHVPDDFTLIQDAVNTAASGDTVLLDRGTYNELLHLPQRDLTLTSNHLFSGDTTDINETILDGEYQGIILRALDGQHRILRVHGFTIMRGLGSYNSGNELGGAIQVADTMSLIVEDTYFTENAAPGCGAIIGLRTEGMNGNLTLRNLKIFNNNNLAGVSHSVYQIWPGNSKRSLIEHIHIIGNDGNNEIMRIWNTDSMFVHDIVVEGVTNNQEAVLNFGSAFEDSYLEMRNILYRNNELPHRSLVAGCDDGTLVMQDLRFLDNPMFQSGPSVGADTLLADSIIFINNHDYTSEMGGSWGADLYGVISNLEMRNNTFGSIGFSQGQPPRFFGAGCSIRNALFENDTIYMHPDPDDPYGCGGGQVLEFTQYNPDSQGFNTLENAVFRDNYYDDPDDYTDPEIRPGGNRGRVLYVNIYSSVPNTERVPLMKHCLFENNRQPNIAPDMPYLGGTSGGVGCIIRFDGSVHPSTYDDIVLEDVIIRDNDDGAILMEDVNDIEIRNLQIIDTPRRGLAIMRADNVYISNLFVSGVVQQANYHSPPYCWCEHSGLTVVASDTVIVRNMTLINSDLPYIFCFANPAYYPEPLLENSLVVNNQYDIWQNECYPTDPLTFYYSCLEHTAWGNGNMFMVDPQFDPVLGPPFLAATSPCIDAGNPDPAQNDIEDPFNPGVPLWPAQGTLRNDIGFTGGPGAMVQEFEGASRKPIVHQQPVSVLLHQNYPNPFNPTTTIEFELKRPMEVTLSVYNLLGEPVAVLAYGMHPAGIQQVSFDGATLASGIYIYRLEADGQVQSRKMLLVK